jgi:LuxR family maltose regulon positive regulatory protein
MIRQVINQTYTSVNGRGMKPSILLLTKFLVPPPNAGLLPRPHLIQQLENQLSSRLILISAPPGYGKTTLLIDFLGATHLPFAWYQLDASDSDPTVFLTYLIESIRRTKGAPPEITKAFGSTAQSLLDGVEVSISPQRVLTVLINELTENISHPWLIVLDDYHYITSPVVHQLVYFLLENAPPGLQLIVSTRTDPPLALARLRARGFLTELRTADLRFRDEEIADWMALSLPTLSLESLALLSQITEGWVAALQMIRSSLSGRDPQSMEEIIASLGGSHRFVFEYLADEVFRRQPQEIQEFLLSTAVLHQMDVASCRAVADVTDAQEKLKRLERHNLFLTSLDLQRNWYRYHYLFREFLLGRLRSEQPDKVRFLEGVAGDHFENRGEYQVALGHFLEALDFESAARVISIFASDYVERGRVEVMHRYLSALPSQVMRAHPDLLLQQGNVHRRLGQAGAAINSYEDSHASYVAINDPRGVSRALTRLAEVNRAQGNYRQAEKLASEALDSAPPEDHAARAEALMALAKSAGFLTDMNQGRSLAEQAVEEARLASDLLSPLARANFLQSLGQICWWHGDPHASVRYCQEALQLAPEGFSPLSAQAYISMVTPYIYWREFSTALQYAERGLEIAQTLNLKELLPSAYAGLGNVLTRLGETARAETCLRQSMEIAQQLGLASYEQLMATGYLAYNLYGQGRIDEAWQIAEGALWSYAGNPDTYEAYVCRSVLADVALENQQLDKAESLYKDLLEIGERRKFNIPLSMVYFGLAYIYLVTGRRELGLDFARRALALIEPSGAIQLFLDQGKRTDVVCRELKDAGSSCSFLERVIDSMPQKEQKSVVSIIGDTAITVKCLGAFQVLIGTTEVSQERWVSAKARDLLAYFVTFRRERIPMDRIFDAIWAERAGPGMAAFHTALSRLRSALRTSENAPRLIFVETGEYWLEAARFNVDVDEFDALAAKARVTASEEDAAQCYERAVALYRGEFLQNMYYDWLFPERRRLNEAYLRALRSLAAHSLSIGKAHKAIEHLQNAIKLDPLSEELYCQAMRACSILGERSELVRYFQDLKRVLSVELNMQPQEETTRLYQSLLAKTR